MIRCLAIDDEALALDLLEDNIRQVPFLSLVKRCKNAYEAIEVMGKEDIDLLFLDIQMPGITGLQFLQSLRTKPIVIFITAYKQHALQGFELDVLDYLVKPVPFERFLKSAHKALEFYTQKNKTSSDKVLPDSIFVNSEYSLVKLLISDITYIEGLKDYIKIYTESSPKALITRISMKAIEEKLPVEKFIRVHKSFIISLAKVVSIRKNRVRIAGTEIPISDHYRENLFRIINPTG
jgi:DNA-binding LytR/AlgR family response regulator